MSKIYFSQIREDCLIERILASKFAPERIAIIGSGGCSAFSILDDQIKQVFCIDQNPAQCALIELKKAAIRSLKKEEYLGFIGEWPSKGRIDIYKQLTLQLPIYARAYWERNIDSITVGINRCGVNEKFYRFIGENICNSVYGKEIWNQLFTTTSIDEQHSFYHQYLTSPEWKTAIKILLSKTTHLQFFPAYMFNNASEHDFGEFFLTQFEKEVKGKRVINNYFISQILFSSYLYKQKEGTPFYLSEEGYNSAKRNIEKITVHPQSLQLFLEKVESIDAFYLSNIFDWASYEGIVQICKGILAAKSKDAVLLYRNMLSVSKLPAFFEEQFEINRELSKECFQTERSMLYQKLTAGQFR